MGIFGNRGSVLERRPAAGKKRKAGGTIPPALSADSVG
jgi:hypothetical protein